MSLNSIVKRIVGGHAVYRTVRVCRLCPPGTNTFIVETVGNPSVARYCPACREIRRCRFGSAKPPLKRCLGCGEYINRSYTTSGGELRNYSAKEYAERNYCDRNCFCSREKNDFIVDKLMNTYLGDTDIARKCQVEFPGQSLEIIRASVTAKKAELIRKGVVLPKRRHGDYSRDARRVLQEMGGDLDKATEALDALYPDRARSGANRRRLIVARYEIKEEGVGDVKPYRHGERARLARYSLKKCNYMMQPALRMMNKMFPEYGGNETECRNYRTLASQLYHMRKSQTVVEK